MRLGQVEDRGDRRERARALAGFYAAGGVLSSIVLLLPGWDGLHVPGIAATVVLALLSSLLLVTFPDRFSTGPIQLLTASGTLLIGACQVLAGGGSPTAMYAMLYIWVVLHSSLFSSRTAVVGHLVLTTVAHATALVWLGDVDSISPQLALTLGTQVAAAIVVGSLAVRQRALADTDSLTGLGNRRVADRTLDWSLERSRRWPSSPTFVALLDLDDFKALNDERGHAAGDGVLVETARAWSELLRRVDLLARTGGDEFTLVLTECRDHEAEEIVRRMIAATPGAVQCSAGLARWDGTEAPGTLLARADRALYEAKKRGPVAVAPTPVHARAGD